MVEGLSVATGANLLKTGVSLGASAWKFLRSRKRHLGPSDRLTARTKWKPLFEQEIWKNHKDGLRKDVIVRDVRRLDNYPDIKEGRGISPWFRASLVDTYHRGFYLALSIEEIVQDSALGGWRGVNYDAREVAEEKVFLLGSIPFEQVEQVEWDGDEYYYFPHIYCHFDIKRQPYELLAFYQEREGPGPNARPYYSKLVDYDEVRRNSRKAGLRRWA